MKKRVLALLLALVMVMTVVPAIALAEDTACVAKIGDTGYATLAEAIAAANQLTGDVTVEIYGKAEYTAETADLIGAYDSISFVGKTNDAEISITRNGSNGYISGSNQGNDCKVNFKDLKLSKAAGEYANDAGFMNVYFTVYRVGEVNYENCTFPDGACAQGCPVSYTKCTFANDDEGKYNLWVYNNTDCIVDTCTFNGVRGVKMYIEHASNPVANNNLTIKNSTFAATVTKKPAIVLTYGKSVTLENNTYSSTGVFELDADGEPNGTTVTADITDIACKNDNYADCGVLVDGKIYTTITDAAAAATSGSTVTLFYSTNESVTLAANVTLNKNGYTADNVTVPASVAQVGETKYTSLAEAIAAGGEVKLLADIELSERLDITGTVTLNLNGKSITSTIEDNYGAIYVKKGAELTVTGEGSITSPALTIGTYGTVNVAGGSITTKTDNMSIAALYAFYYSNEYIGTVNISGGEINRVFNCGTMTVSGGEIAYLDSTSKLTVEGGKITSLVVKEPDYPGLGSEATITGGTFSQDPSAYVGDGYVATLDGSEYTVAQKSEDGVAANTPSVEVKEDTGVTAEQVENALNNTATNDSLVAAAPSTTEETQDINVDSVLEQFDDESITKDNLTFEIRPSLEVEVESFDAETSTLTVNIEAVYDVVAVAGNKGVVVAEKELDTKGKDITITLPLPDGFNFDAQHFYVKHTKDDGTTYTYAATVDKTAKTATFVNPNGFSQFELLATNEEQEVYEAPKFTTSLTLNETLDMNFYMNVESVGENANFKAYINDEEVVVSVTTIDGRYRVRYSFQAHQMTQEITVQCVVDGEVVAERAMSIQSYCAAIFEKHMPNVNTNDDSELQCAMAVAVLDYGSLAQIGKGNTSSLANANLTPEQRAVYTKFWQKYNG